MNQENNRSAAGLRRSAIVARIRLREEWSALKGADQPQTCKNIPEIIKKTQKPACSASKVPLRPINRIKKTVSSQAHRTHIMDANSEVLRGVVALVDVGMETKALALRAALMALGATVVPAWSPLVTHLIWTQGGCRATRAKARALACRLVSPLWVEACASTARRVPESAFPAAARDSDLPSPRALRAMLKRAEAENIPLANLLSERNSKDKDNAKEQPLRLRISSETEQDSSTDQADTSHDRSTDTTDPEVRVNTLPRGGQCAAPPLAPKSRRKLFTHKEAEDLSSGDETVVKRKPCALTRKERRDLARAERMARRLLAATTPAPHLDTRATHQPRIVLTGMSRAERQIATTAIKALKGRVQKSVNHRTTHILLGSCLSTVEFTKNTSVQALNNTNGNQFKITGINVLGTTIQTPSVTNTSDKISSTCIRRCEIERVRTLNALLGAVRGCRILYAQWVLDSLEAKKWLHHHGYEVPHLRKISQKARVERTALGRIYSEYAYDIFNGMKVFITPNTEQKDAATQLLTLCGGIVQNGDDLQNGGQVPADCDMTLGIKDGEVSSKWVFDSVATGRMRTTRRYVNSINVCDNTGR